MKRTELRRKTPLRPKRKPKPGLTLAKVKATWRKVLGLKSDSAKREERHERDFGPPGFVEFCHRYGCVVARQTGTTQGCLGPIEAAHVRSRGAKSGWRDSVVGLCLSHHREQHTVGIKTFAKRHDLDLDLWACAVTNQWDLSQGGIRG